MPHRRENCTIGAPLKKSSRNCENDAEDGAARGGVAGEGEGAAGGGVALTPEDIESLSRLHLNKAQKASQKASPSHHGSHPKQPGGTRHKKRTQEQLDILSRPSRVVLRLKKNFPL